jgi:hypothetical protein
VSGFVYAIGTIEADYPYPAIEREMQLLGDYLEIKAKPDQDSTGRPTEDRRWQHQVLSKNPKETRWIARQLRWRLTIEDLPVFVLNPSDPSYFDDLIDALGRPKYTKPKRRTVKRTAKQTMPIETDASPVEDLDVVIGVAGPQTPDGIAVVMDQLFQVDPGQLAPTGLDYLPQFADNRGLADEERARNFLAARYKTPPPQLDEFALTGMRVTRSRLGGTGRVMKAIYTYNNAAAAEKELFVRVDVTHEFPMIVTPMQPYFNKGERT